MAKATQLYTIWLKAQHLGEGKTLTITAVNVETLHPRAGQERAYLTLCFKETGMKAIVNQSNANLLVRGFGTDDTDKWVGKQIRLTPFKYGQNDSFKMEVIR